jgi:hypothetical protein
MTVLDGKEGDDDNVFEWSMESVLRRFTGCSPISSDASISWSPYHVDVTVNGRKAGAGKKNGVWLESSRFVDMLL